MDRRDFLKSSIATAAVSGIAPPFLPGAVASGGDPRVAVLLVDTDRVSTPIDPRIYGQFLEHINHSVEDGLFAEQIRGAGFEGPDFQTYWEPIARQGHVEIAEIDFQNGKKSVRLCVV